MDNYDKKMIKVIITITVVILGFAYVACFGAYKAQIYSQSNIIKVYRTVIKMNEFSSGIYFNSTKEELIYMGKRAFISIESGGNTTTVTIYKKLFPIPIIDRTYSDKTIKVEATE